VASSTIRLIANSEPGAAEARGTVVEVVDGMDVVEVVDGMDVVEVVDGMDVVGVVVAGVVMVVVDVGGVVVDVVLVVEPEHAESTIMTSTAAAAVLNAPAPFNSVERYCDR
jgi:hypothetical protein